MAYNNYMFPQGYQPAIIPQYQAAVPQIQQNVPQQQVQPQNNGIIWVQGEQAAKGYPVTPNQSVLLMDSEQSTFYIKSADNAGMPQPLRIFDYSERNTNPVPVQQASQQSEQNFVTHTEFEEKLEEIKSMIKTTTKEKKSNGKPSV
jgi:hypothetical protein